MRISVYGNGLTALVTAWALAESGNTVKVLLPKDGGLDALALGTLPVTEPGLEKLMAQQQASHRLSFTDNPTDAFLHSRLHFIALASDELPVADALVRQLALAVTDELVLVNQSTFPVGTSQRWKEELTYLRESRGIIQEVFSLAFPSFIQEGAAVQGFTRPERLLVGSDDEWGLALLREVLRPFNRRQDALMVMSTKAAEFTKYAINGMLATRLSFMNEMANLADQLGVDIEQVRQGMGSDPRIGFDYIYPGCGFGGQSFSEDVMSLAQSVEENIEDSHLLRTVLSTNQQQKEVLFRKIWQHWSAELRGKTLAVWGAAFKPGTDSIDNAPALTLMEALWAQGARVQLYDPQAMPRIAEHYGEREELILCHSMYEAAEGADALLIVTEWKEFWSPDFDRLARLLNTPLIFDGRNIYDPPYLESAGFTYFGIGRRSGQR